LTPCWKPAICTNKPSNVRNSEVFPLAEIILVETYNGNYTKSEKQIEFVTLFAIVCSNGQCIDQHLY
jgi:hypothetical protein